MIKKVVISCSCVLLVLSVTSIARSNTRESGDSYVCEQKEDRDTAVLLQNKVAIAYEEDKSDSSQQLDSAETEDTGCSEHACFPAWVRTAQESDVSHSSDIFFEQYAVEVGDENEEDEAEYDFLENVLKNVEDEAEEDENGGVRRMLLSRRQYEDDNENEQDENEEDEAENGEDDSSLQRGRRRRHRRRKFGLKKVGKAVKKTAKKATKVVKKTATKAAEAAKDPKKLLNKATKSLKKAAKTATRATKNAISKATRTVSKFASKVWKGFKDGVTKLAHAAAQFAEDMYNAMKSLLSCFNLKKLMFDLLFGNSKAVDADKSDVNIHLSAHPTLSAKIVPRLGLSSLVEIDSMDSVWRQNKSGSHDDLLSWQYGPKKKGFLTVSAGARLSFDPELDLTVEPVAGAITIEFSGDVTAVIEAEISAAEQGEYKLTAKYPKKPLSLTGCAPVFCITLLMQGLVELEASADAAGHISSKVTATYGVSGSVHIDITTGQASANVGVSKLTHKEEFDYESTFQGKINLKAGPVFTVLPTPGAPVSFEPYLIAQIKAYASAGPTKPCGKAGVNVYADPQVSALGFPEGIDFDSKLIEDELVEKIAELPTRMEDTLLDLLGGCHIPGMSALKSALNTVMKKATSVISKAIPDFKISFGKSMKLFAKSVCFNVLKVALPA